MIKPKVIKSEVIKSSITTEEGTSNAPHCVHRFQFSVRIRVRGRLGLGLLGLRLRLRVRLGLGWGRGRGLSWGILGVGLGLGLGLELALEKEPGFLSSLSHSSIRSLHCPYQWKERDIWHAIFIGQNVFHKMSFRWSALSRQLQDKTTTRQENTRQDKTR